MPGAASGLTRLDRLLPELSLATGVTLRLVREREGDGKRGADNLWVEPIPGAAGLWLEIGSRTMTADRATALAEIVGSLVEAEQETAQVATELSGRYEEIDLIYTISEILGHTIRLDEAARRILHEVATVVGARRASLFVLDEEHKVLRAVAAKGNEPKVMDSIELDDDCSVAARAFREMKIVSYDPSDPTAENPGCPTGRSYRGRAFLSVPVLYASPGGQSRPIGVINLTDRTGPDAFSAGDRKLVAAIANQIGAALENARLVQRDLRQQRMRRELELAHDLQLKLLPSPAVLQGKADVAVRCRPADSVGGDFYNLLRLHGERVGVMIGDVSSHGFGAALIMALAMAASGIHAELAETPADVLAALEESLADELSQTEMFLSLFYAVVDPAGATLAYANAGHPHAFLVDIETGESQRLEATRPPLGLGGTRGTERAVPWRRGRDMLCLFTDGIADAVSEGGERFGEERVLSHVRRLAQRPAQQILDAISTDVAAFTGGGAPSDDRTLLLLKS